MSEKPDLSRTQQVHFDGATYDTVGCRWIRLNFAVLPPVMEGSHDKHTWEALPQVRKE